MMGPAASPGAGRSWTCCRCACPSEGPLLPAPSHPQVTFLRPVPLPPDWDTTRGRGVCDWFARQSTGPIRHFFPGWIPGPCPAPEPPSCPEALFRPQDLLWLLLGWPALLALPGTSPYTTPAPGNICQFLENKQPSWEIHEQLGSLGGSKCEAETFHFQLRCGPAGSDQRAPTPQPTTHRHPQPPSPTHSPQPPTAHSPQPPTAPTATPQPTGTHSLHRPPAPQPEAPAVSTEVQPLPSWNPHTPSLPSQSSPLLSFISGVHLSSMQLFRHQRSPYFLQTSRSELVWMANIQKYYNREDSSFNTLVLAFLRFYLSFNCTRVDPGQVSGVGRCEEPRSSGCSLALWFAPLLREKADQRTLFPSP